MRPFGIPGHEMRPFEDDDEVDIRVGPSVIGSTQGSFQMASMEHVQHTDASEARRGPIGASSLDSAIPSSAGPQTIGAAADVDLELSPGSMASAMSARACGKFTAKYVAKLTGVILMTAMLCLAVIHWPPWVISDEHKRTQVLTALFIVGLFTVAVEDLIGMNKSPMMLLMAGTMWSFLAVGYRPLKSKMGAIHLHEELNRGLQEVGSVVLFLLPAMGVVESIDHFDGFALVTALIKKVMAGRDDRLMPIVCSFTFVLSSVIDNLTATIVAIKLLKNLSSDREHRHTCGGMVVLAANAGGAWSPVGDVTTTMLWIQGKITTTATTKWLLLPSLTAGLLPLLVLWWRGRLGSPASARDVRTSSDGGVGGGNREKSSSRRQGGLDDEDEENEDPARKRKKRAPGVEAQSMLGTAAATTSEAADERGVVTRQKAGVLAFGILMILMVPVLKIWTALPPYLGMLLALGAMWLLTDSLPQPPPHNGHTDEESEIDEHHTGPPQNGVVAALHNLDLTGLLFFTGILLAVEALNSAGILKSYATNLVAVCQGSPLLLCSLLGISSALVDNVPLVQASIDMFHDSETDDPLWQLVALAAGTGGSILSIGSISGVTLMSMDGVSFGWYSKTIGPWAMLSFFSGLFVYELQRILFG